MCLTQLSTKKNRDKFLKEARKRGYIRVYKVCERWYKKCYTGWAYDKRYKPGLRRAERTTYKDVNYGFHAHLSLGSAKQARDKVQRFCFIGLRIKTCYAKPAWVKGLSLKTKEASFTHLVFPDWEKGDMTIREFQAACKGVSTKVKG